jgi:hypothetical protein
VSRLVGSEMCIRDRLIDGFKALGWLEVSAYQGALAVYGLCCVGAYAFFLVSKKT